VCIDGVAYWVELLICSGNCIKAEQCKSHIIRETLCLSIPRFDLHPSSSEFVPEVTTIYPALRGQNSVQPTKTK
jgi:hypothetical protein